MNWGRGERGNEIGCQERKNLEDSSREEVPSDSLEHELELVVLLVDLRRPHNAARVDPRQRALRTRTHICCIIR